MANTERIEDIIDEKAFRQLDKLLTDLGIAQTEFLKTSQQVETLNNSLHKIGDMKGVEKAMKDIEGASKAMQQASDKTAAAADKAKKAEDEAVKATMKRIQVTDQEIRSINGVDTALEKNIRTQVRIKAELSQITKEKRALTKEYEKGTMSVTDYSNQLAVLGDRESKLRTATIQVNAAVRDTVKINSLAEDSNAQLSARLQRLTKQWDNLSEAERENADVGGRLKREIDELDEAVKGLDASTGRHQRNVGNYASALGALPGPIGTAVSGFASLREQSEDFSETLQNASGSPFEGFTTGIKSITRAGLAFIATPIGATIAAITAAVAGAKAWYDYNKSIAEATKLTKQLTGLSGDDLRSYRAEVQAVADTFGVDFNETLMAANSLAKQQNISFSEALSTIEKGFLAGANASGDFLNQLKEYPSQMESIGISAEETTAIIADSTKEGIFSDKGIDAIKEAGLRIREMTQPTKDAFKAIGMSSEEIQRGLSEGSITMFDVIQQVSDKLKVMADDSPAVGMAMADIFGGAGEDAGLQYLRTLGDIETNLDKVIDESDELTQAQLKQLEANKELNAVWGSFFDSTGGTFELLIANGRLFLTNVLIGMIEGVVALANYFIELYNDSMLFRAGIQSIKITFENAFDFIVFSIRRAIDGFKDLGAIIGAVLRGDLSGAVDAIGSAFTNQVDEFKKFGKDVAQNYIDGVNETINAEKIDPIKLDFSTTGATDQGRRGNEFIGSSGFNVGGTAEGGGVIFTRERVQQEVDAVKRIIDENKKLGLETMDAEARMTAFIEREAKKRADAKIAEEERALEEEKQIQEARKELVGELAGLAITLIDARFEREKNRLQEQSEQVDANAQKEIERINESAASEEEKANRIKIVEARAQAQREELARRQKQVEIEQARFRKLQTIAQIIQNTALAITTQLAGAPLFPISGPLIPIIAGIGAAQVAQVLATPIPQYFKGTDSSGEGPAWVGERGTELRIDPDGTKSLTPDRPTLTWLKKGTQIIPNHETKKMIVSEQLAGMASITNYNQQGAIDEGRLAKAIGREIGRNTPRKQPQSQTIITKGGMKHIYKNGSSWTEYINRNIS